METGITVGPYRLVVQAIESCVGIRTSLDCNAQGFGCREAEVFVAISRFLVLSRLFRVAGRAADRIARVVDAEWGRRHCGAVAELEVADLVREADVVTVRGPDHSGLFGRRAVHGVERIRNRVAAGAGGVVLELRESIGWARGHRTRFVAGEIVDLRLHAVRRVVNADLQVVA